MNRLLCILFASSFLAATSAGCIVHTKDRPHHSSSAKRSKRKPGKTCRPSHYWDGNKCRHKGKGKGARKHDY